MDELYESKILSQVDVVLSQSVIDTCQNLFPGQSADIVSFNEFNNTVETVRIMKNDDLSVNLSLIG